MMAPELDLADDTRIGELVARHPWASRVFERHGIDYCCGGGRAFADACRERGLALEDIARELRDESSRATAIDEPSFVDAPLGEIVDHVLERYHAPLREDLPRLARLAARAIASHGVQGMLPFGEIANTLSQLDAELHAHLLKEEIVLFPFVQALERTERTGGPPPDEPCGSVEAPIGAMEHEHAEAAHLLERLQVLTGGHALPAGACATVASLVEGLADLSAALHRHIHLENEVLFPRAAALARKHRESAAW